MSFFALLLALLIEQARPLARGNAVYAGVRAWAMGVGRNFDAGKSHHGWVVWSLTVLLPSSAPYTHLTLPTTSSGEMSVVAVPL